MSLRRGILGSVAALALLVAAVFDADASCRYTKFATMPLQVTNTRLLLEGSLNGKPQIMMVDTGSDRTWLPRKTAEDLGLKFSHTDYTTVGVGGESQLFSVLVKDMTVGKVHWERVNLEVVWDADFAYGAVIGADFLMQNDIELALRDKEMRFFEPKDCDDSFLAYWDDNAVVVPLIQVGQVDLRPIVEVQINGKTLRALLDSGAPDTTIDLAVAAALGVTPKSTGVVSEGKVGGVGKHDTEVWSAPFDSFSIGGETIKHPRIMMHDLYGSLYKDVQKIWASEMVEGEPPVILGADFLRAHRVLLAVSQHKVYLSYAGGPVFAPPPQEAKK